MPRRRRLDISGGTYYVVRRTRSHQPVFSHPDDYVLLTRLLPAAAAHSAVHIFGYCLMPDAIHLALQVDESPLSGFMQELTSHYAQHVHRRTGERGQLFRGRYDATLVEPRLYLPKLVHYLHCLPVLVGLAQHAEDYAYSSHLAYLGRVYVPWLTTKPRSVNDSDMHEAIHHGPIPPKEIALLFERGHTNSPGILGSPDFIETLPRRSRPSHGRSTLTLQQIVIQVARAHGIVQEELLSPSRRQPLVIARAQITWYATTRRVASLREVARYLNRTASCLRRTTTRIQHRQPELLSLNAFVFMAPLASSPLRSTSPDTRNDRDDESGCRSRSIGERSASHAPTSAL